MTGGALKTKGTAAAGMQAKHPGVLRLEGMADVMEMTTATNIMITEALAETAAEIGGTGIGTGKIITDPSVQATAAHRLGSIWE